MRQIELLAPARDASTAFAAILHGADAVYIGAPAFGARAAASNSLNDVAMVVNAAHPFGVKVYVTLNTIIYRDELEDAQKLVEELWRIGVDALIVQDMSLLELTIPPIDLHASTQTDARNIEKIRWLADAGFSQIVLPREFSLEEIREANDAVPDTKIEAFVHGALCVSYSGDCHAGAILAGRSANRGECPQICRLEFTLTDKNCRPIKNLPDGGNPTRHWLSLADLNRIEYLKDLIDAGVSSFKIEGRLKPESYVKNITLAYSQALNHIIENSESNLRRASFGHVTSIFKPDPSKSFNRGFTSYFLTGGDRTSITSWETPKWIGRPIGKVILSQGNRLNASLDEPISNGDGLGYFTAEGKFSGFRVNKADGEWIYPAPGSTIPTHPGTTLYRNADKIWEELMSRNDSASRKIAVEITLRQLSDKRIAIDATDERGCSVSVTSADIFQDKSHTPQAEQRRSIFSRLGETIYQLINITDLCGDLFVPSKALTALRRDMVAALDRNWRVKFRRTLRRPSKLNPNSLSEVTATYHENIANPIAEEFYRKHGASILQPAAEVSMPKGETRVMTTRYCLRRELGACLKTKNAKKLPDELYLNAPIGILKLKFDCQKCNMHVMISKNKSK